MNIPEELVEKGMEQAVYIQNYHTRREVVTKVLEAVLPEYRKQVCGEVRDQINNFFYSTAPATNDFQEGADYVKETVLFNLLRIEEAGND